MKNQYTFFVFSLLMAAAAGAQTLTVGPAGTYLQTGAQQQFTATATGLTPATVKWEVVGGAPNGAITPAGLYTAPPVVPMQSTIVIRATSLANTAITNTVTIAVRAPGPVIATVDPTSMPTGPFSFAITGTGFQPGAYATINGVGFYPTVVSSTQLTLTGTMKTAGKQALNVANPNSFFSNIVYISFTKPTSVVTISPPSVSVATGGTRQFTALLNGVAADATWAVVTTGGGTITSAGLYTAPASVPNPATATISATVPGQTPVTATVTVTAPPALTISPATASVNTGAAKQFSALVNNVAQTAAWSVITPAGGAITSAGLYTAPATVPSPAIVTISATVSGQPPVTATITVTAPPPPPTITISPATVSLYTGATQQFSALLNGVAQTAAWSVITTGGGTITSAGLYSAPATVPSPAIVTVSATISGYAPATATATVSAAPPPGVVSASAAKHFLQQAAFGPSASSATNLQQLGFPTWLAQQYASPKVSNYSGLGDQGGMPARFISNAVNQPDQLRQRVAFALSQIFVTSINVNIWNGTVAPYEEMLMADAFTNYRQIMYDVTLSAAMGQMLNMANNGKANASGTVLANENYAREIMQLFTVGTVMLNTDGSKQLDSLGNPIPVYSQSTISQFAKVYTGWTYAPSTPGGAVNWGAYINPAGPMVPYDAEHDTTVKTLLNYPPPPGVMTVLPAGQSAVLDLNQALDNIFNHPNVGPFVARLIIQHLVKSNPSPAYIQRVSAAFNNNGHGVRGDMQAVISAILLDPEARQNDTPGQTQSTDGHLQEPLLFLPGLLRGLGAVVTDQNYFPYDLSNMEQDLYNPPSVFNYYSPGYVVPGFGLSGPEFQIYDTYSSLYRDNVISELFGAYSGNINSYGPATTVDLTSYVALAGNPTALVNALDQALTNGEMPAGLKQILVTAVQAEQGGQLRQVQTALYLLLSSGYYNVWN
jgi:hypothetical protein